MGSTVALKPSPTQQLAAHFTLRLCEAADLSPGDAGGGHPGLASKDKSVLDVVSPSA
jgi:hypothetical protein